MKSSSPFDGRMRDIFVLSAPLQEVLPHVTSFSR
jgi:hypothetical protein